MKYATLWHALLGISSALVLSCSTADSVLGDPKDPVLVNPDAFGNQLSTRSEPMVWYGYYPLGPGDSLLPGKSTRSEIADQDKDYCAEDSHWWSYITYTPVYQSRAAFEAGIVATTDSVTLLNPGKLMVLGNYKFVTDVNRGVHIYDDTDPANPKKVAFIAIPGTLDIALKNNTLLANAYSALVAIDVSNPAQAKLQTLLPAAFPPVYVGNAPMMDSLGNVAVAWSADTVWECGTFYYDYVGVDSAVPTSGSASEEKGNSVLGQNASLSRFAISEDWLYTVDSYSMRLFDISTEKAPLIGSVVQTNSWDLETIFRSDSVLYVGSMTGMHIYVHSKGSLQPVKASSYEHVTSCDPVVVQDGIAYVTLRSGSRCMNGSNQLEILDVKNPYAPKQLSVLPLSQPAGLAIEDSTLYVCEGSYGLTILDVLQPTDPKIITRVTEPQPEDVIAQDGILTLIGTTGIWRYDASDRSNPVLLGYTASSPTEPYYPEVMPLMD